MRWHSRPSILEKILVVSRQSVGPLSVSCLVRPCGNYFDVLKVFAKMLEGV